MLLAAWSALLTMFLYQSADMSYRPPGVARMIELFKLLWDLFRHLNETAKWNALIDKARIPRL